MNKRKAMYNIIMNIKVKTYTRLRRQNKFKFKGFFRGKAGDLFRRKNLVKKKGAFYCCRE